jgi:hypothetical protein
MTTLAGESPILSWHLWKTSQNLWKTCGEVVEKKEIHCGKGVE